MTDTVSIIVPTFNRAHFLCELLDSLIAQSYQNWECLIVDDGSNDNTEELVLNYIKHEQRIRFYKRAVLPKGAPTCRNLGIEYASGKYLLFLDSDDLLMPFCLKSRIEVMNQDADLDFVVKNGVFCDKDRTLLNKVWNKEKHEDDLVRFMYADCVWSISGGLFRSTFIKDNEIYFDSFLTVLQDTDFHIQVLMHKPKYKKLISEEPDYIVRRHGPDSISQKINPDFSISAYLISKKLMKRHHQFAEVEKEVLLSRFYYDLQTLFFHKHFTKFFKEVFTMNQSLRLKVEIVLLSFFTIFYIKIVGKRPEDIKSMIHQKIMTYHNYPRTIGFYEVN